MCLGDHIFPLKEGFLVLDIILFREPASGVRPFLQSGAATCKDGFV